VSMRHLLIAGTGRAGTTALVQLLDACGLATGSDTLRYFATSRAGLERKLITDDAPYVIKQPFLSEDLAGFITDGFDAGRIDAIIVPLRNLKDAATSRIQVFREHGLRSPGGLWRSLRPGVQLRVLGESEHQLLMTAAEHHIRVVLINFPRFVNDAGYAWTCLGPVLLGVDEGTFIEQHAALMRPQLVSSLTYPGATALALLDVWWLWQRMKWAAARLIRPRRP
jgi:pimeloyl-ACP methyl ester carboxylesterase